MIVLHGAAQGKISCKILDTLQKKGHFTCKILAPCKFLTRFLLLAKNCARNVKFLASLASFLQERGHFQCTLCAQNVQELARYFSLGVSIGVGTGGPVPAQYYAMY